jgi:hypothetical protein
MPVTSPKLLTISIIISIIIINKILWGIPWGIDMGLEVAVILLEVSKAWLRMGHPQQVATKRRSNSSEVVIVYS